MHNELPFTAISIIICTYNGGDKLHSVFSHIMQQEFQKNFELIVVDNNSTDNTASIIQIWFEKFPSNISCHYVVEKEQGLVFARRAGVEMSSGKYLIFCDDDNWLFPDFLSGVFNFFENHPHVGMIGGEAIPVSNINFPDWFERWQYIYACGQQNRGESIHQNAKVRLWGAGLCIRAYIAARIFKSSASFLLTDRKGLMLTSGGDDEICYRFWILGYNSSYVPSLKLRHFMPDFRLTIAYRDKLSNGFSLQVPAIGAYQRYLDLLDYKGNRLLLFLRKIFAWLYYTVNNADRQAMHASDFLYYISGASLWQREETRLVKKFAKSIEKKRP